MRPHILGVDLRIRVRGGAQHVGARAVFLELLQCLYEQGGGEGVTSTSRVSGDGACERRQRVRDDSVWATTARTR